MKSVNAFVFSLKNKDDLQPFKAPVYQNSDTAFWDGPGYSLYFGNSADLSISENANLIPTPTQILVLHTNLLQATLTAVPTPKLFWLALTTSLHLK